MRGLRGEKQVVEGLEDCFEESEEDGIGVGLGRDDTINPKEKRVGLRDERVESFRNGSTPDQGFDVGDRVEDQENQRVRKSIKAVHFCESRV